MTDAAVVDETGGAFAAGSVVELARPAGQAPRTRFRHVLALTLEVPAGARPVVVDAVLRGAFRPLEHDAVHPGRAGIPAASLDDVPSHPFASVTLPGPRELLSVTIGGVASNGGIGLYRLDGSTPSGEPTVTGGNGSWVEPGFVDVRFAVGADGVDGPAHVGGSNVQQVSVRTIPTGPAIAAVGGDAPDAVTSFWRGSPPASAPKRAPVERPGSAESRTGFEVALGGLRASLIGLADVDVPFDVGGDLRTALQSAVDGASAGTARISLVFEADQPCAVGIDELTVSYRAVLTAFDDSTDGPLQLTFPGTTVVERDATITLPAGSTVTSASVRLRTELRSDRSIAGAPGASTAGGPGLELVPGRVAAGAVAVRTAGPPRATAVSGLVVSVIPMEDGTELTVALQEDRNGSPSGADLARSSITLGAAGTADRFVAPFREPVSLSAGRYWVVAQATHGRSVWLADRAAADDGTGTDDGAGTNRAPGTAASIGPLAGPLAPAAGFPRVSLLTAGGDGPPLTVSVGGLDVVAPPAAEGQAGDVYDVTDALQRALEADAGPVTVRFASASVGTATTEPRVEFDLPGG